MGLIRLIKCLFNSHSNFNFIPREALSDSYEACPGSYEAWSGPKEARHGILHGSFMNLKRHPMDMNRSPVHIKGLIWNWLNLIHGPIKASYGPGMVLYGPKIYLLWTAHMNLKSPIVVNNYKDSLPSKRDFVETFWYETWIEYHSTKGSEICVYNQDFIKIQVRHLTYGK